MFKKIFLALCFCLTLFTHNSKAEQGQELIGERYKIINNLALSFIITAYYTIVDSNQMSQDAKEWAIDTITAFNILWRSVLFGAINYLDYSYIPDHTPKITDYIDRDMAKGLTKDALARGIMAIDAINSLKKREALAATTAAMITYNTRYDKVIVERFNEVQTKLAGQTSEFIASMLSVVNIMLRNLVYFYTLPILFKPVNDYVIALLPRQQVFSQFVFDRTQSIVLAHAMFTLADILYKHVVMSIKHTIFQFVPTPSNAAIFRFDDCSTCYLGTNPFGKSGPFGRYFGAIKDYAQTAQDGIVNFFGNLIRQAPASETCADGFQEDLPLFSTAHGTQPFYGNNSHYAFEPIAHVS